MSSISLGCPPFGRAAVPFFAITCSGHPASSGRRARLSRGDPLLAKRLGPPWAMMMGPGRCDLGVRQPPWEQAWRPARDMEPVDKQHGTARTSSAWEQAAAQQGLAEQREEGRSSAREHCTPPAPRAPQYWQAEPLHPPLGRLLGLGLPQHLFAGPAPCHKGLRRWPACSPGSLIAPAGEAEESGLPPLPALKQQLCLPRAGCGLVIATGRGRNETAAAMEIWGRTFLQMTWHISARNGRRG